MSKIQVEVSFTDELKSIRVGGKEMEIPKAIKTKPVEEWFEPTVGRVRWGGLGAEIKEMMGFSNENNAVYSFLFIGPEDKKQEFMACVERFCLGEEAQQETQEETEQDYLHNAQNYQQAGNAEMAFQQYMVAARDYGHPKAQFEVARCYQNGTGVEKTKKMRSCGTANLQNKAMQWHNVILAIAIIVEKALKKTLERRLSGIANLRSKEMQQLNVTLQYSIKMDMV